MNEYKRGDVFYANLTPVVGSEQGGLRPVVIVSNNIGNHHSTIITVAVLTSRFKKMLPTHVAIPKGSGGLIYDSCVMAEQLRSIDKQRLTGYMGSLNEQQMSKIDQAIKIALAL